MRPVLFDITNVHQARKGDHYNAKEGLCSTTPITPATKRTSVLGKTFLENYFLIMDFK